MQPIQISKIIIMEGVVFKKGIVEVGGVYCVYRRSERELKLAGNNCRRYLLFDFFLGGILWALIGLNGIEY